MASRARVRVRTRAIAAQTSPASDGREGCFFC